MEALQTGKVDAMKLLMDHGADPNEAVKSGEVEGKASQLQCRSDRQQLPFCSVILIL